MRKKWLTRAFGVMAALMLTPSCKKLVEQPTQPPTQPPVVVQPPTKPALVNKAVTASSIKYTDVNGYLMQMVVVDANSPRVMKLDYEQSFGNATASFNGGFSWVSQADAVDTVDYNYNVETRYRATQPDVTTLYIANDITKADTNLTINTTGTTVFIYNKARFSPAQVNNTMGNAQNKKYIITN